MKNFVKKFLLVLLALMPCFQTQAMVDVDGDEEQIPIPLKPKPNPTPNTNPQPRARARFTVENGPVCYYYQGEVSIEAESGISFISATVIRLEDNESWTNSAMDDTLIINVSEDPGTYILTFTLSNGQSYIGEYYLY